MGPLRIVLKDHVSRDDVDRFAWKEGWSLWDFQVGEGLVASVRIHRTEDDRTTVHELDDPIVDLRYLVVSGADVERIAGRIRDGLACHRRDEILSRWRAALDPFERARLVRIAGLAATDLDPGVLELVLAAVSDRDSRVRASAAVAAAFTAWPELRGALEQLCADPAPQVADVARTVLRALVEKEWIGA